MFRGSFELRFFFPMSLISFLPICSGPSTESKSVTLQATSTATLISITPD
jgi:hypothetical protein